MNDTLERLWADMEPAAPAVERAFHDHVLAEPCQAMVRTWRGRSPREQARAMIYYKRGFIAGLRARI